jgi:hypothetical protein
MLQLLRRKNRLDLLLRQRKLQKKKPREKLLKNSLLNLRLRLKQKLRERELRKNKKLH